MALTSMLLVVYRFSDGHFSNTERDLVLQTSLVHGLNLIRHREHGCGSQSSWSLYLCHKPYSTKPVHFRKAVLRLP